MDIIWLIADETARTCCGFLHGSLFVYQPPVEHPDEIVGENALHN